MGEVATAACVKCGNTVSVNAKACPKCGHFKNPEDANLGPCRACGVMLPKDVHRQDIATTSSYISIVEGTGGTKTTTSRRTLFVACPNCGEPRPIRHWSDGPLGCLYAAVIGPPIVAVAVWIIVHILIWMLPGK